MISHFIPLPPSSVSLYLPLSSARAGALVQLPPLSVTSVSGIDLCDAVNLSLLLSRSLCVSLSRFLFISPFFYLSLRFFREREREISILLCIFPFSSRLSNLYRCKKRKKKRCKVNRRTSDTFSFASDCELRDAEQRDLCRMIIFRLNS